MIIKQQVISGFNRGAETYQQAAQLQARVAEKLASRLSCISAKHILEIGCGTGLLSQHLVQLFPQASLLLSDIAPNMVTQCQEQLRHASQVQLVCADGEALQTTHQYDLITASMVFHWFKDLSQSLSCLKQKLTKGGHLVFAMLAEDSLCEWQTICRQFDLPIATPVWPAKQQLEIQFPNIKWEVETLVETYPNLRAFLNTLKLLGATATRTGYSPQSSTQLRTVMREINHEIQMTYSVIYGEYCAS